MKKGAGNSALFATDEEAQFDADCQYDKVENTRLTLLEVLVYLKNTEYAEKTIATYEFWSVVMTGKTAITRKVSGVYCRPFC